MSKEKDIVTDILSRAEAAIRAFVERPEFVDMIQEALRSGGGLEDRIADQLAQQIQRTEAPVRRDWARTEAYIAAKSPVSEEAKARAVAEASRSGRVVEAANRHGISRATMYRLLKK